MAHCITKITDLTQAFQKEDYEHLWYRKNMDENDTMT